MKDDSSTGDGSKTHEKVRANPGCRAAQWETSTVRYQPFYDGLSRLKSWFCDQHWEVLLKGLIWVLCFFACFPIHACARWFPRLLPFLFFMHSGKKIPSSPIAYFSVLLPAIDMFCQDTANSSLLVCPKKKLLSLSKYWILKRLCVILLSPSCKGSWHLKVINLCLGNVSQLTKFFRITHLKLFHFNFCLFSHPGSCCVAQDWLKPLFSPEPSKFCGYRNALLCLESYFNFSCM